MYIKCGYIVVLRNEIKNGTYTEGKEEEKEEGREDTEGQEEENEEQGGGKRTWQR